MLGVPPRKEYWKIDNHVGGWFPNWESFLCYLSYLEETQLWSSPWPNWLTDYVSSSAVWFPKSNGVTKVTRTHNTQHTHTHTHNTHNTLGWLTPFHHITREDLQLARRLIPEGLAEYVKVTPPSVQQSHKHQLIHYPRSVESFGSLSGSWMFTDERRNKVTQNPNSPTT